MYVLGGIPLETSGNQNARSKRPIAAWEIPLSNREEQGDRLERAWPLVPRPRTQSLLRDSPAG